MRRAALVLVLLTACAGTEEEGPPDASVADAGVEPPRDGGPMRDAGPPPPLTVEWSECGWVSDHQFGEPNVAAQCGTVSVPLDYDDPWGRRIEIDVRRLEPPEPATVDLWLLNGGPGGSAQTYERSSMNLSRGWRNVRVYLADARGAGRSSRLGCAAEEPDTPGGVAILEEEWDGCVADVQAQYGDGLAKFDTTSAARDLVEIVDLLRADDVPVYVHGTSYGTFWVQRALQIDPNAFDAVILDSVVAQDRPELALIDEWHDEVGREFLALCGLDPLCSSKLGNDPVAQTEMLFSMLETGHCAELDIGGHGAINLIRVLFGVLISGGRIRGLIPATVYRALRCDPEDVRAITNIIRLFLLPEPTEPRTEPDLFSQVLARHVVFSEMWNSDRSPQSFIDFLDGALMSKDISASFASHRERWPKYELDEYAGKWPQTTVPVLLVNGTLDPQTPIDRAIRAADVFTAPNQTFVTLPNVSHGVFLGSLVSPGNTTCGIRMLTPFLRDPTAPIDSSCTDDLIVLDFELSPNYARNTFGTDDLWD